MVIIYGSFTRAAELLNYSQSGISRMIADLEREWNVKLLYREKGGVKPTSEGECLLPAAKSLVREFDRLQAQVDELKGLKTGLVRIGVFSSAATHILPPVIKRVREDHPAISYELLLGDYTEIEKWIAEGRVDCGFVRRTASPDMDVLFLQNDPLMVVLPKDHPLANEKCFPIKKLADEPFILLSKDGNSDISDYLQKNGVFPQICFTTWDDYAVMSMVESALGVSMLPALILRRIPYDIAVLPPDIPAYRSIGLGVKDISHASIATKCFIDYLKNDLNNITSHFTLDKSDV